MLSRASLFCLLQVPSRRARAVACWKRVPTLTKSEGARSLSASTKQTAKEKLTTSYACGPSNVPLLGLTVGQLLQRSADLYGDRMSAVFVQQGIRATFDQVLKDADQVAAGLVSLGLKRGDRIGVWGPNTYEWLLTQWAAARAGLVLVNINPAYKAKELRYAINLVEVKALVTAEQYRGQSLPAILSELIPDQEAGSSVSSSLVPSLERVIISSGEAQHHMKCALNWKDVIDSGSTKLLSEIHSLQRHIQFDEPANIQFTSGTTGNPKGATLSHHNIVNNAYSAGLRMGYHKKVHTICVPVPLYHCFGCGIGVLTGASHGASCVFPSPVFSARETVKAIDREKCTSLYGTPTMFVDILNLPNLKDFDVKSLSTGIMAGAPCPQELAKLAVQRLNMKDFAILYGMTECSPVTFQTLSTDSLETRCSTVGYPFDHVEVKIIDPATGEIVPVNTPGEICTRGYNTMLGYWNQPEKTSEIITADRWIRSGDIGVMNEDGYGQIVGRIKDMIIRGGENIFPREIEELLHTHPEIQEAHVIGVPDPRLGEEICAWVRLQPDVKVTASDVKEFCKAKLSYFKVPRYILFKDSFPQTVTGKVQKFVMKEVTIKELGL